MTSRNARWFAPNFFLILFMGVGTLYWLGYHTEWLSVVGGVLGLGGAFAWVAFVLGLVREDRKAEMQIALDGALSSSWAALASLLTAGLLIGFGGLFGSVRIDALRDADNRFVEIRQPGEGTVRSGVLTAQAIRTFPLFVGWAARPHTVHVSGLPELVIYVEPYRRLTIRSPHDFLARNVVLLRPTTEVTQTVRRSERPFELTVQIGEGRQHRISGYRGEAVWIGCEQSVAIPSELRDRWRLELAAAGLAEAQMLPWLSPKAVASGSELAQGDRIRIELGHSGQRSWFATAAVVEECRRSQCFPQEVILDAP